MERTEHDKQAKHNKTHRSEQQQVTKQIFPKYTKGKEEKERGDLLAQNLIVLLMQFI
jgi:hypothetical protein